MAEPQEQNYIQYAYAQDKDGIITHISKAERHIEYSCPYCRDVLIPRKGDVNRHHYAHKRLDCEQSRYLHETTKQYVIQEFNNGNFNQYIIPECIRCKDMRDKLWHQCYYNFNKAYMPDDTIHNKDELNQVLKHKCKDNMPFILQKGGHTIDDERSVIPNTISDIVIFDESNNPYCIIEIVVTHNLDKKEGRNTKQRYKDSGIPIILLKPTLDNLTEFYYTLNICQKKMDPAIALFTTIHKEARRREREREKLKLKRLKELNQYKKQQEIEAWTKRGMTLAIEFIFQQEEERERIVLQEKEDRKRRIQELLNPILNEVLREEIATKQRQIKQAQEKERNKKRVIRNMTLGIKFIIQQEEKQKRTLMYKNAIVRLRSFVKELTKCTSCDVRYRIIDDDYGHRLFEYERNVANELAMKLTKLGFEQIEPLIFERDLCGYTIELFIFSIDQKILDIQTIKVPLNN